MNYNQYFTPLKVMHWRTKIRYQSVETAIPQRSPSKRQPQQSFTTRPLSKHPWKSAHHLHTGRSSTTAMFINQIGSLITQTRRNWGQIATPHRVDILAKCPPLHQCRLQFPVIVHSCNSLWYFWGWLKCSSDLFPSSPTVYPYWYSHVCSRPTAMFSECSQFSALLTPSHSYHSSATSCHTSLQTLSLLTMSDAKFLTGFPTLPRIVRVTFLWSTQANAAYLWSGRCVWSSYVHRNVSCPPCSWLPWWLPRWKVTISCSTQQWSTVVQIFTWISTCRGNCNSHSTWS